MRGYRLFSMSSLVIKCLAFESWLDFQLYTSILWKIITCWFILFDPVSVCMMSLILSSTSNMQRNFVGQLSPTSIFHVCLVVFLFCIFDFKLFLLISYKLSLNKLMQFQSGCQVIFPEWSTNFDLKKWWCSLVSPLDA